jgi:pyrroline-5-carboxylate reductase
MKVCIIGCGNMGLIYAQLLLKSLNITENQLILIAKNETRKKELTEKKMGCVKLINSSEVSKADVILIAVKPQDFFSLSERLKDRINKEALIISIMAGINISILEECLNHRSIIRAMPNAPALFGKGISVYYCTQQVSAELLQKGLSVLELTGKILKAPNEALIDSVTAISGSGPAYFFYLTLLMKEAAIKLGMEEVMAEVLVRETLIGSAEMVSNIKQPMSELIKTIASKGGTTEAALKHFDESNMNNIVEKALDKATKRSIELAKIKR